jgi:hypothetical protein
MADVVPLRPRAVQRHFAPIAEEPVIFDDARGPGWLAAQWGPDSVVEFTVSSLHGSDAIFRLAATDVLELVRVLVEGLNEPAPTVHSGPPAQVLKLPSRPR